MRFAHFFIDRPVFASVLAIVTVIVGGLAAYVLPIAQYPEIVPPTVVVTATYPGANSETVAKTVAAPIEQEVNGVENMLYMSSNSTNDGQLRLTVTFKLGTDLDQAQVQVQNRVSIAEPRLPEEVRRLGVNVKKTSPDITLVVQLYSDPKYDDPKTGEPRYSALYQSNYLLLNVRDQISRLPGVGDVFLFGARDYSMRVWLNPDKVASVGLTAGDVVQAIRDQNVQVAAGVLGQQPLPKGAADYQLAVNAQGRLTDPKQFEDIVVKSGADGRIIRLRDVGYVTLGAQNYGVNAYLNGRSAVALPIFQLPGTNAIETADAVYAKMKVLEKDFPPGLKYAIPYDTTVFVRESLRDVLKTLAEAILLVVIVVLVFLQSWRASIIPLLAVPVSLIGTCAVLYLLGFSLNNLSLFGLVLAIGIVVDDAIVVVENVERWIARGLAPREATYRAMEEVTPAVIAVALGLSAVFIPTAFISGITGQFYRQFALTIAVSTLISAFNSLTLSPALAAILLKPHDAKPDPLTHVINFLFGWFFRAFNAVLGWLTAGYVGILSRLVRVAALVLLGYVGLLVLTYFGFKAVPTGFIPGQDAGYVIAVLQMPDGSSLDRTDAVMRRMQKIADETEGVQDTFAITGYSALTGTNQANTAAMFVVMKPFEERAGKPQLSAKAIMGGLFGKFSQIQEGVALVFPPPPVRGLSNAGGFKMQVQDLTGTHTPVELQDATDAVINAGRQDPRLAGLFSGFRAKVPQVYVDIDRERVRAQGIPIGSVFETLQIYLGSLFVNDFNFLGRTYQVTAQADAQYRLTAADIAQLKTRNSRGEMVPLGSVLTIKDITGPDRVNRYNLYTSAEINGAAAPGVSSGTATAIMENLANKNLPPGFGYQWTELTYQEKLAGNTALFIFPLCILFVFLTHAAEYESWSLPTAIILIVPMCLLCAIGGVFFSGMDNNIFTQIGLVVLAGLSAKNAVLIVEFAKQQQEHGKDRVAAALEASRLRLRPILMTSFAFILGVVPLVIATGAGSEMRQALGTAVFYGMLGVTIFGIFLTPIFFVSIRWVTEGYGRWRNRPTEPVPATPYTRPDLQAAEEAQGGELAATKANGQNGSNGHT